MSSLWKSGGFKFQYIRQHTGWQVRTQLHEIRLRPVIPPAQGIDADACLGIRCREGVQGLQLDGRAHRSLLGWGFIRYRGTHD